MLDLQPPRHTSTLRIPAIRDVSARVKSATVCRNRSATEYRRNKSESG
jgi:hypothetical protein